MGSTRKGFPLLLIAILAASSLITVESVAAQSIPKPSPPEFTLNFIQSHYNSSDPNTGVSKQIENNTLEFIIKNQLLPVNLAGNSNVSLYYLIRFKDHYNEDGFAPIYSDATYHSQSNSANTVLLIPLNFPRMLPPVDSGVVDFQVQAQIGYYTEVHKPGYDPDIPPQFQSGNGYIETNFSPVEKSDWSNTQTINIVGESPNSTTVPNSSSGNSFSVSLSILFGIVTVFSAIIVVLSLLLFRRHRNRLTEMDQN